MRPVRLRASLTALALTAHATTNVLNNDVRQVTARPDIAGAPQLPVYYERICPA